MNTKPIVFYMTFDLAYHTDVEEEVTYGFNVYPSKDISTEDFDKWFEEVFSYVVEDTESDYGVHDYSSSPDDRVHGIGYCTYEVEPNRILLLMKEWQEYFGTVYGKDNVSDITQIFWTGSMNDYDIANIIKGA